MVEVRVTYNSYEVTSQFTIEVHNTLCPFFITK